MKVKGTTLYPQQVIDSLNADPMVNSFVVIRELDAHGNDVVRVLLDTEPNELHGLGERLGETLRVRPVLELADPKKITALRNDPKNRKPTPFIDRTQNH